MLYATATLYRALAIVHGIVWEGSGRGARVTPSGVGIVFVALLLVIAAAQIVGSIRRHDQLGGLSALLVYLVLAGGAWLLVSLQLPHRDVRWQALLPGAAVVGVGLLFVNVFNVYVTTRLVEGHADTYGALGIATALLLSLVIVGRLIVFSAELNPLRGPTGAIGLRGRTRGLLAVAVLGFCTTARADGGGEQALAKRYAPVVRLVVLLDEPDHRREALGQRLLVGLPQLEPWCRNRAPRRPGASGGRPSQADRSGGASRAFSSAEKTISLPTITSDSRSAVAIPSAP